MDDSLQKRVDRLDVTLFETLEPTVTTHQGQWWDRRSFLALHSAVAAKFGSFTYLEVGSYLGGSLQALAADPRCEQIVSIDPRPPITPDKRGGSYTYVDNTVTAMLANLSRVPKADTAKILSLDCGTETLSPDDVSGRPAFCFVDGEHTDTAALRDARFCHDLMAGEGVVAFHDQTLVAPAIRAFLRTLWPSVSHAVSFPGEVFAIEFGDRGVLRSPVVRVALASRWHTALYRAASQPRASAAPFIAAWRAMPVIDRLVSSVRSRTP